MSVSIATIGRALERAPSDVRVWQMAASQMLQARDWAHAVPTVEAIAEALPSAFLPRYQIGVVKDITGDWPAAAYWLRQARTCATKPTQKIVANKVLGDVHHKQGNSAAGDRCYAKALRYSTLNAPANYAQAEILLSQGEWERGWRQFEYRWHVDEAWRVQKLHGTDPETLPPEWDGRSPGRMLVCSEQGSGDTLWALRYLEMYPGDMILQCQREIVPFVKQFFPDVTVIPNGEPVTADWSVPIMSLPYKLGHSSADELLVPNGWMPRERGGVLKVGICWKGSPDHGNDKDRSSPIDFRGALAGIHGVELVSLQYGEPTRFRDYLATAEVILTCDRVVTVDTSVAHLAGTLGVPTYVIPPVMPDWRWPRGYGDSTPWYPSMTLLRRRRSSDWDAAIRDVRDRLTADAQ